MLARIFLLMFLSVSAEASQTNTASNYRPARDEAVVLELLGKGTLGSIGIEPRLYRGLSLGTGVGFFPGAMGDSGNSVLIPVYLNYSFSSPGHGGIYALTGAEWRLNYPYNYSGPPLHFQNHRIFPLFGGGYEYQALSGLLLRAGLNLIDFFPWPGVTVGFMF